MDLLEIKALPPASMYATMVSDMFKEMGSENASRLHAAVGISGEMGELMLACYNEDLDNFVEEGGDALFYLTKLLSMECYTLDLLRALPVETDDRLSPMQGMILEASNLLDVCKKSWVYGKDLNHAELVLTLAKFFVFFEQALQAASVTVDDLQAYNQWKLVTGPNARYPSGKYSDAAALARADKAAAA